MNISLGARRFNKAVCSMALMDMPEIAPLLVALSQLLKPGDPLRSPWYPQLRPVPEHQRTR